jgi:hypothetical protein
MVCHLIEFVKHHSPALESIRINPTWIRHDTEEEHKPRRRKIWVHGAPPPPTGWDLIEKYNFLGDLDIPQVLLDPCLSPNVVIASVADVVPRYVLGIVEHSLDPIVVGQEVYCPRCGLVGKSEVSIIVPPPLSPKGSFKCLNQLCDFEQYPIKKMTTQEQEAVARRGLSSLVPRVSAVRGDASEWAVSPSPRTVFVDPAPNEDRTVLRAGGGNIPMVHTDIEDRDDDGESDEEATPPVVGLPVPVAHGGDRTREVAREQLRTMRAGIRGNWERAHAGEENLHYPGDPLPPYQTETNSEGEERGPGRIDINTGPELPEEDDNEDSDVDSYPTEAGTIMDMAEVEERRRIADETPISTNELLRERLRTAIQNRQQNPYPPGRNTPEEHRREHDPLTQTLWDLEHRADNESDRKRIRDVATAYLSGRIDGEVVQRALQRIAREPNEGRRDRRR